LVRRPTVDGGSEEGMGRVGAKKFGEALPHRVVGVHLFQHPSEPASAEIYAPQLRSDGNQKTVLVGEVQLMEPPETVIPSLVRFDRVDRFFPHSLHFSGLSGFVF
jgi:hypothetical protein